MASVEQVPGTEETTTEVVNTVVEEGARLGVKRFFTIPGRDPFDEIEWETRDALIPGRDGPAFEQRGVEFPKFWSQTATNIVAQKYFRGRLSSPERESSVKQMVGRVVDTVVEWGKEGGYFADADEAETFEAELKTILVNQYASFNSPVWFNVGFEASPQCSACFILSIEDSMDAILDWIRREGVIFRGGSGSGVNLSRLRSSKEQLSKGGYASGPVSFMRGADASAGTIKSGGKTRRAAKMVVLDVDHPDIEEFIWCKAKEEKKARVLESGRLRHVARLARLGVDPVPEREQLRPRQRHVHGRGGEGRGVQPHRPHRRHRRRDEGRARPAPADRRGGVGVRRPGRAVRHDDQLVAHAPEHGPHQRVEPVLGVHVDRRLGVQPRVAQPHEVPPRGRRVRRRGVRARVRRRLPRAGDPRRLLVVSDGRDRPQREAVPPARPRLREPRRAAHGAGPAVRLRRGTRLRGGDHRAHDGPRVPQVRRDRLADGAVRRLPGEPRADDRRHREAPRRGREHRELRLRPGRSPRPLPQGVGRRARPRRDPRLPQRAGDRARSDRDDQLHDGLRHDRRRARLLAREVEEARRRRRDHDRQQDGADGARAARLRAAARARRSSRSSTSGTAWSARRTSSPSTTRSSTAPSASGRSTTPATSG